jgi:putative CocE/NonD family hydrolase
MAPGSNAGDMYLDVYYIGGVFREEFRIQWGTGLLSALLPLDPGSPDEPGYEMKKRVFRQRFNRFAENMNAGKNPMPMYWLTDSVQHRLLDSYWQPRTFIPYLRDIKIPALHSGVWYDHFIRGTLACFEGVQGPRRLFVGPGYQGAAEGQGDGGLMDMQVRWFDYYLRGIENGVTSEPAAKLYVYGAERWIEEPSWPLPTRNLDLYFATGPGGGAASANDGLLLRELQNGSAPDPIAHDPARPNITPASFVDQRSFERGCLTYSTPPLEEDLEVIGMPRVMLHASTSAADVDWCVRLCDVYPDGRARLLNFGAFKGSHLHSHTTPVQLEPERVYEFEVEVWQTANVFRKGHRIRIDVSTSDSPFFESNPLPSRNLVFHDAANPSRLVLPVVDRR